MFCYIDTHATLIIYIGNDAVYDSTKGSISSLSHDNPGYDARLKQLQLRANVTGLAT